MELKLLSISMILLRQAPYTALVLGYRMHRSLLKTIYASLLETRVIWMMKKIWRIEQSKPLTKRKSLWNGLRYLPRQARE
jgi:hypothetical protein